MSQQHPLPDWSVMRLSFTAEAVTNRWQDCGGNKHQGRGKTSGDSAYDRCCVRLNFCGGKGEESEQLGWCCADEKANSIMGIEVASLAS